MRNLEARSAMMVAWQTTQNKVFDFYQKPQSNNYMQDEVGPMTIRYVTIIEINQPPNGYRAYRYL